MAGETYRVVLSVYDLSQGMAGMLSMGLLGQHFPAIYHTSVVVYETEYYFGRGIHACKPGHAPYGQPMEGIEMGETMVPIGIFMEYLEGLSQIYSATSYDLFDRNCNNFSNDVCHFLVDQSIPEEIMSLPRKFLATPVGQLVRSQIDTIAGETDMGASRKFEITATTRLPGLVVVSEKELNEVISTYRVCLFYFTTDGTWRASHPINVNDTRLKVCNVNVTHVDGLKQTHCSTGWLLYCLGERVSIFDEMRVNDCERAIDHAFSTASFKVDKQISCCFDGKFDSYTAVSSLDELFNQLPRTEIFARAKDHLSSRHDSLLNLNDLLREVLHMLEGPANVLPLIELLRLLCIDQSTSDRIVASKLPGKVLDHILNHATNVNLRQQALQLVCNLFHSELFIDDILFRYDFLSKLIHQNLLIASLISTDSSQIRDCAISTLWNLCKVLLRRRHVICEDICLEAAVALVGSLQDTKTASSDVEKLSNGKVLAPEHIQNCKLTFDSVHAEDVRRVDCQSRIITESIQPEDDNRNGDTHLISRQHACLIVLLSQMASLEATARLNTLITDGLEYNL